jgi:biotin synthase
MNVNPPSRTGHASQRTRCTRTSADARNDSAERQKVDHRRIVCLHGEVGAAADAREAEQHLGLLSDGQADRVDTLRKAETAGLSPDSVPIDFLIPFEGTPLGQRWELTLRWCLRILALFRVVFRDVEVRLAGGRVIHLRGQQSLALHLADSIFLDDYLTGEGQSGAPARSGPPTGPCAGARAPVRARASRDAGRPAPGRRSAPQGTHGPP